MITFYSKKDCVPCEIEFQKFRKKFRKEEYNKVTLLTNEEALETVTKYGVRTVPFLVIQERTVIPTSDLIILLKAVV